MISIDLRNGSDASLALAQPGQNFGSPDTLWAWEEGKGLIFFSIPFPMGASVASAKLRVYSTPGWSSGKTLSLHRVTERWTASYVSWNTEPGSGALSGSVTKPGTPAEGEVWEVDVTSHLQDVANGAEWYGWRVSSDNASPVGVYGLQAPDPKLRPVLEVKWAEPPHTPNDLSPRGDQTVSNSLPYLQFNYVDAEGASTMLAYEVQMDGSGNFDSPAWSRLAESSSPGIDLSLTGRPALVSGNWMWWRVRVQDSSGLWSGWSDPVRFKYQPLGSVSILSPSGSTEDPSPDVVWNHSFTQTAFRLKLYDKTADNRLAWDTELVQSSSKQYTIPVGVIDAADHTWEAVLEVKDDKDRVAVVNGPVFSQSSRLFTWDPTPGMNIPLNVRLYQAHQYWPGVGVQWDYPYPVTYFSIWRDGVLLRTATPVEAALPGGGYGVNDWFIPGRQTHKWEVRAHHAGQTSDAGWITKTINHRFPFLMSAVNTELVVPLVNAEVDPGLYETNDVAVPLSGNPVLVQQSLKGYVGSCEAEIACDVVPGVEAREHKNMLLWMRENPRCYFTWADQAIECYIYDTSIKPVPRADGRTDYEISFGFIQTRGTK